MNLKLGASALQHDGQSTSTHASGCAKCQPTRAAECVAESLIPDDDPAPRLVIQVQNLVYSMRLAFATSSSLNCCKFRCSILLKYRCTAGNAESLQVLCRDTPVFPRSKRSHRPASFHINPNHCYRCLNGYAAVAVRRVEVSRHSGKILSSYWRVGNASADGNLVKAASSFQI